MALSLGDITRGMTILYKGELYEVLEFEHVKRARGSAFVRAKLKELRTGRVFTETLRESDTIEHAFLETRPLQYLYQTGDTYVFMDKESYEQYELPASMVEDIKGYLLEGMDVQGLFYKGQIVKIKPPTFVVLTVVDTPPGVKGDTATGGEKPATLETGLVIKVPLFVKVGDKIKVDTRTRTYVERVSG